MFTFFSDLPSELRIKIWQSACFSRTLTLTYSNDSFHCTSPPPALLSSCHEARHEALNTYTLFFGTKTHSAKTYFNPFLDTLYLPRTSEMGYDESLRDFRDLVHDPNQLLNQVRCIAVDHVDVLIKRPWEAYNKASLIRSFTHLEQITLVLNDAVGQEVDTISPAPSAQVVFQEPQGDPEEILRIWYCFKQGFAMEEKQLEDVCRDMEKEYTPFILPTVRIRMRGIEVCQGEGDDRSLKLRAGLEGLRL